MTKRYISSINGDVVQAVQFTGLDNLQEIEIFSGIRPSDVYQLDKDPNHVSCSLSPMKDGVFMTRVVLTPGMYLIKKENGFLSSCDKRFLNLWYEPVADKEESDGV